MRPLVRIPQKPISKRPLVQAIALALSLSVSQAHAATIVVNASRDNASSLKCSLGWAIVAANTDSTGPVGGCTAGSGADIIDMSAIAGVEYQLEQGFGSKVITSDITIQAHGVSFVLNSAKRGPQQGDRLFLVTGADANLTVNNINISNADDEFGLGGAITVASGATATINQSTLASNYAQAGGAIHISGNSTVNINDSTLSTNTVNARGGAIYLGDAGSTVNVSNSTISGNSAAIGGAVYSKYGAVLLDSSTISENNATYTGGVSLKQGYLRLSNTILANSSNGDCDGGPGIGAPYAPTLTGVNLVEDGANCDLATATPTLLTDDPGLSPLGNHGGGTQTHALSAGSVAIDAVTTCAGVLSDQRGLGRTAGACDIGSFEVQNLQSAADFIVTSSNDLDDGLCEALPGHCSLREALNQANADVAVSAIKFDGSLVSPPVTITLGGAQLPVMTTPVTIQGQNITINGANKTRIFELNGGDASLTLNDLHLANGAGRALQADAQGQGGAILLASGAILNMNTSSVSSSTATQGGAIRSSQSEVHLDMTTISGNNASSKGGGIYIRTSGVTTSSIVRSTLVANTAFRGGGFYADDAKLEITDVTISGNSATNRGGGLHTYNKSKITINHSTISGNTAAANKGGVYVGDFSTLTLNNTIIANTDGGDCYMDASTINTIGNNIVQTPGTCVFSGNAVQQIDPMLGELLNHGGPTLTHLPLLGSPVVEGGDNATVPSGLMTDQRYFTRIFGLKVDLGAVEVHHNTLMVNTTADSTADDGQCSLREAVVSANNNTASGIMSGECGAGTFDYDALDLSLITGSTITLAGTQLPQISSTISIAGNQVVVDANAQSRVFDVRKNVFDNAPAFVLADITLQNGSAGINKRGGALKITSATVTLSNVNIQNSVANRGGGLFSSDSNLRIEDTTLSGNTSSLDGGGLYLTGAQPIHINRTTISGNSARAGGALYNSGARQLFITNSTISGNEASAAGGAMYSDSGTITITQSTISGNTASNIGGIFLSTAKLYLNNSVLANSVGDANDCYTSSLAVVSLGFNLVESANNCVANGTAFLSGDPLLGPLQDNGGLTATLLALNGSPLINAGDNTVVPAGMVTDQRGAGFVRIGGGTVDIGSVEVQPVELMFKNGFE